MPKLNYGCAYQIMTEFYQCRDEGLDVGLYERACHAVANSPWTPELEDAARALTDAMSSAPVRGDYEFSEPSDYASIRAARPSETARLGSADKDTYAVRLRGAWLGRIAGCLLGKPIEGRHSDFLEKLFRGSDNYPLNRYIKWNELPAALTDELKLNANGCWADKLDGIAPSDDDTNYTTLALKLLDRHGRGFTPADVLNEWAALLPAYATFTAERIAYRNLLCGMAPPDTAVYYNPCREYIGAQIRGDLFGYINPGDTAAAAEMAWRDASVSHVKNGIYGEMFIAAMLAAAAVTDYVSDADIFAVIEAGLAEIPAKCRLRRDVGLITGAYKSGAASDEARAIVHAAYDERTGYGWCHASANSMIVTLALLYGGGDFGKTVCLAVGCAFDTDCNGATAGSIIGMLKGETGVPDEWTSPFGGKLRTDVSGYGVTDAASLAERTLGYTVFN